DSGRGAACRLGRGRSSCSVARSRSRGRSWNRPEPETAKGCRARGPRAERRSALAPQPYDAKSFIYNMLRLAREGELDQVGGSLLPHLAGALERRALFDLQTRRDEVGENLRLG